MAVLGLSRQPDRRLHNGRFIVKNYIFTTPSGLLIWNVELTPSQENLWVSLLLEQLSLREFVIRLVFGKNYCHYIHYPRH